MEGGGEEAVSKITARSNRSSSRWTARMVASVSLFAVCFAGAPFARATATMQDVIDGFESTQADIMDALMYYRQASPEDAFASLATAKIDILAVQTALQDPAIVQQLGKGLKALNAKVTTCIKTIDAAAVQVDPESGLKAKPAATIIKQLATVAKTVKTSEETITKAISTGKGGTTDKVMIACWSDSFNFKAGQLVTYSLYPPGYPTVTTWESDPVITLKNSFGGSELDLDYGYQLGAPDKKGVRKLTMRMGPKEGYGGSFDVNYQGVKSTRLIWNRGSSTAAALIYGMDGATLIKGSYTMSIGAGGTYWWTDENGRHTGTTSVPVVAVPYSIPMNNLKSFGTTLVNMFNKIAPSIIGESGFTRSSAICTEYSETSMTLLFSASYGDKANGGIATVTVIMTHI
jgi:hypothetical protein